MELSDLVGRAQEAMDRGEYRLVVASCSHALETYPTCVSLHRMLGEAHLEQGETEPAIEHFERALSLDPLNVYVRLGLGVAFEERSDPRGAYAHYLHAWELNPALDQLRDELLRLRTVLGATGRLHPTRAGLAAIYARGGRLNRAATEWRAVLAAEGGNSWARMALAEVLWRQGDDAGAAAACRAALQDAPENVRALAILAEIERRKQGLHAKTYADQYRAIDPIGDVVQGIVEIRPGADFSFLLVDHALVEEFDFEQLFDTLASLEPDTVTPTPVIRHSSRLAAPDLWDSLVKDLEHDSTAVVAPFNWADDTGEEGSGPVADDANLSLDELLAATAFGTEPLAAPSATEAEAIDADEGLHVGPGPDLAEVVSLESGGFVEAPQANISAATAQETPLSPPPVAATAEPEVGRGFTAYLGGIEPFNFDPADDSPNIDVDPEAFAPEVDVPLAEEAVATPNPDADWATPPAEPVDAVAPTVEPEPEPTLEPILEVEAEPALAPAHGDQFITADGRVDLTVGWDDLDRTLQEATPGQGAVAGYDGLMADIDAGGIAPFDLLAPAGDEAAWEPFTNDDFTAAVAPAASAPVASPTPEPIRSTPAPELTSALSDSVDENWNSLEAELASTLPDIHASGYTEVFRGLDEIERLEPYIPSPDEVAIDPLAVPDAVGEPLIFDDLLAVTSQDAVGPQNEQDGDLDGEAHGVT
ncbi:MAG: tetratricopeptide repeat protein, partial [Chloroflexota bacterium]|nr:tetratricopeptide repeat protein [Chloroflexota bacterium]